MNIQNEFDYLMKLVFTYSWSSARNKFKRFSANFVVSDFNPNVTLVMCITPVFDYTNLHHVNHEKFADYFRGDKFLLDENTLVCTKGLS